MCVLWSVIIIILILAVLFTAVVCRQFFYGLKMSNIFFELEE